MKSFSAAVLVTLLAGSAAARNCNQGLDYCGSTLMNIGKYGPQIQQALYDVGHSGWSGDNVLFKCRGGPNGAIEFIKGCGGGCVDNGSNKSDTCR